MHTPVLLGNLKSVKCFMMIFFFFSKEDFFFLMTQQEQPVLTWAHKVFTARDDRMAP